MIAGNLLIRADANVAIGTGHVMRCLALAQAWQDSGGRCIFAAASITPSLEERLRDEGFDIQQIHADAGSDEDARETANLCWGTSSDWIVVDGYHFDAGYQLKIRNSDCRFLFLDDHGHANHYYADLILNQNPDAQASTYVDREPYTELLLGPGFTMLRREFDRWREWERIITERGRRILITMGGSDPDNLTLLTIKALKQIGQHKTGQHGLEVIVAAGGSNPYLELLKGEIAEGASWIHLQQNVANMPELMAWADIAVIAAGGTLAELFFMGCPILSYARDVPQGHMISQLEGKGLLKDLGHPRNFDPTFLTETIEQFARSPERRSQMSALGRQLVDGRGAARVCEHLMAQTDQVAAKRIIA